MTKRLLVAATRENVPCVALAASQKLGAKLAISDHSRQKVSRVVKETTDPTYISYLKATISYPQRSCLTILSDT